MHDYMFFILWDLCTHSGYFCKRIPVKLMLMFVCMLANYIAYLKRLNKIKSLIFVCFSVLCFQINVKKIALGNKNKNKNKKKKKKKKKHFGLENGVSVSLRLFIRSKDTILFSHFFFFFFFFLFLFCLLFFVLFCW